MGLTWDQSGLVITLVAPYIHKSDLLAFQAASKICQDVALPYWYGDLCLPCCSGVGAPGSRRLYLLLRTLMHNPNLQPLVRRLSVIREGPRLDAPSLSGITYPPDSEIEELDERDQMLLVDAIKSIGLSSQDQWIDAFKSDGAQKLVLPLLLWHVPNLRTLYLDYLFHAYSYFLRPLMLHIANGKSGKHFKGLENVTYAAAPIDERQDLGASGHQHVQALFYLPEIRNTSIALDRRPFSDWPPALRNGSVPHARFLRVLKLQRCESDLQALKMLVLASPQLAVLSYEWWRDLDRGGDDCIFHVDSFLEAIFPVKKSLNKLSVGLGLKHETFDVGIDPGWYGIRGHIKDLREFENLKQLRVPLRLLLPVKFTQTLTLPHLPLSVENLTVREDGLVLDTHMYEEDDLLSALKSSFSDYRVALPGLRSIDIEVDPEPETEFFSHELQTQMSEEALQAGFKSAIVNRVEQD